MACIALAPAEAMTVGSSGDAPLADRTHWRSMCFGARMPDSVLTGVAARHETARRASSTWRRVTTSAAANDAGLDLVWLLDPSVPASVEPVLADIAADFARAIDDPITIEVNLRFEPLGMVMGEPILGGTGSSYSGRTYPALRAALIADADPDDTIEGYLPDATGIDVLYALAPGTSITVRTSLLCQHALLKSIEPAFAANPIPMTISSNVLFDLDPSDGIDPGAYCLRTVLTHEVCHGLGFGSNVDFLHGATLLPMDLYRFRASDGGADLNPDTLEEFTTTPRTVYLDTTNSLDDATLDFIDAEYAMSDGSPWQGSHWTPQPPATALGIMVPVIQPQDTFYPRFLRAADLRVLDALGWDITRCPPDLTTGAVQGLPGYGVPNGILNNDDFFYYLAQFAAGNLVVADLTTGAVAGQPGYGVPNGVLNNDDFFYYLAIFAAGC
ncbi:MAG: NF038122 family metalloprotease [Phycisphaerales bacterium]